MRWRQGVTVSGAIAIVPPGSVGINPAARVHIAYEVTKKRIKLAGSVPAGQTPHHFLRTLPIHAGRYQGCHQRLGTPSTSFAHSVLYTWRHTASPHVAGWAGQGVPPPALWPLRALVRMARLAVGAIRHLSRAVPCALGLGALFHSTVPGTHGRLRRGGVLYRCIYREVPE